MTSRTQIKKVLKGRKQMICYWQMYSISISSVPPYHISYLYFFSESSQFYPKGFVIGALAAPIEFNGLK